MRCAVVSVWLALAAPLSAAEIHFDFGENTAGTTPTNFASLGAGDGRPGEWKIVMEEVPPLLAPLTDKAPDVTRRCVLAQTSQNPTDEHFPLFVYEGETFTDFQLTTRFKIIRGEVEQMAGVVFRFQNVSNFYVIRASALGHNVRFYKMVDGLRTDPIGPELDVATNVWHTLAISAQGNQFTFWFDGRLLMPPLQDNSFDHGKVGFWTKSDAVSYFTDTSITYTPRVPQAQMLVENTLKKQPRILGLEIYTLDSRGKPRVLASKDKAEAGQPGTDAEAKAITDGSIFYGREKGVDTIVMPLRNRNGDPIAAVRLELKSFFGETQQNALTRARMVLDKMQSQVSSAEEFLQ